MIRGLAPAAAVVWFLALSVLTGASVLLARSGKSAAGSDEDRELSAVLPGAALTALLAGVWILLAKAIELAGAATVEAVGRVALETRFGRVWCFGEAAIGVVWALLLVGGSFRERARRAAIAAGSAALVAQPFASHSAGDSGSLATLAAHALHLLAV